jgi:hypothetical protein
MVQAIVVVDVNIRTKITALLPPAASIRPANLPQHHNPGSLHLLIFKTWQQSHGGFRSESEQAQIRKRVFRESQ